MRSLASDVLLVIFGLGVRPVAGHNKALRISADLLWVLVLACVLFRSEARNASRHQKEVPQS